MKDDGGGIQLPKRKRNKDDGELDITPMIDITFLLLAFFVVSSKMDPQKDIALPFATYGESVSDQASVTLLIIAEEGSDNYKLYKGKSDDDPVLATDPEEQEEEISAFVDQELATNPEKTTVLIKAAGDVKTGVVEMCRRAVTNAELFGEERKIFVGVKAEQ